MTSFSKCFMYLLFLTSVNNTLAFYIHNITNSTSTSSSTTTSTTVTTTEYKEMSLTDILITLGGILGVFAFVICCCVKWNKDEEGLCK